MQVEVYYYQNTINQNILGDRYFKYPTLIEKILDLKETEELK